jgi:4-amino-4-deoxy-L-arabinose transferase-like glycosyltransferase
MIGPSLAVARPVGAAPAVPRLADGQPAAALRRRIGVAALLAGTALLYLWELGASGYANEFYAAAAQAGTKSWTAFFFGSFDSSNFITVDKPPLFLWPMELAGRIFGFNAWSLLVPQAVEGVASVWLLYATVERWHGHRAGLLAGVLLALTPVAVLMFRFDNPDAAMVLLVVAAAYCTTRAVETASTRWLLGAGAIMGLSFLAKGLQPFTVLPALAITYLVAAPTSLRRRLGQLFAAGLALLVGAGWWVAAVSLTPAADRPYVGGSSDNSVLDLAFGYNGLSRLSGSAQGGPGGGFDGSPGIGRLFNSLNGGQIGWLLPAALLAAGALAVTTRRTGRTDRGRAALLLWGGWLLVTGAVLSFAGGIIHTYYTVELAPAVAALVAVGAVTLWRRRQLMAARLALAAGAVATGWWTRALLARTSSHAWLGYLLVVAGLLTAALLLAPVLPRLPATLLVVSGLTVLVGGSAAYAADTVAVPHTGSIPAAGPSATAAVSGGPGGGSRAGLPPAPPGRLPNGARPPGAPGRTGALPGRGGLPDAGRLAGGAGTRVSAALTTLLQTTHTRWAAAAIGSQTAGPLELASGRAVMSIGGFNGADPAPTLAQFEADVRAGLIGYFVVDGGRAGGGLGGPPGGPAGSAITAWVEQHFTATTVGATTVYQLS